jgi:hypothetical protein
VSWLAQVRRASAAAAVLALAATGTTGAAGAAPAKQTSERELFLVAMHGPRVDSGAVLREVGSPTVVYRYRHALNGFAAQLDAEQVKQLEADRRVALVERSTKQHTDAQEPGSGPRPGGSAGFLRVQRAWASTGGPDGAGRGTVVGVVDSGIWPENPSFAALPETTRRRPAGFRGVCDSGEQWGPSDCNSKVVAARWFVKGFGEDNLAASEYLSPRDGSGHGSHTAALAAGNDRVRVRVEGQDFGQISGMAPGARIAAYKVCWTAPQPRQDGCTTADTVAGIDQAVADGVDVISYAISGRPGRDSRAVELALLNATSAGIFVAASAGDRGPAPGTVAHASPWVTTVGASTQRTFQGAVVAGGRSYVGAMVSDRRVRRTGIVLAEDAAAAGSSTEDARLCRPGALDASVVGGKIVVCDRGSIPRVDKSAAVARAGGEGMVLANVRPDTVAPDFHSVPTVHLDAAAAEDLKRSVRDSEHPTASLDPTASDDSTDVPKVAPFSSRGPVRRDGGSLVKPDLTAPGVAVMSAVAPPLDDGRRWDQYSGTSMSTAHVAGLSALVMAERPRWTPAMVKSAMSTTADELDAVGGPLAAGAGQVRPGAVLDPGLVLDEPTRRYRAWLAGRVATRNLNLPSIAVGDLTGRTRVVRRVTNVSGSTETYSARVLGLEGLDVRVRPASLQLRPGETGRFAVVFRRGSAQLEAPARGSVVWTGLSHEVRLPVVATPRTASVPREAAGSGTRGSVSVDGVAGTSGLLDLEASGLVPAEPVGLTLEPGGFDATAPEASSHTAWFPLDVPADADVLRVELRGRATDDLDVRLYRDGRLVGSATGPAADEVVTKVRPRPGRYDLYVSSVVAGNRSTTTAQLYTWVLPSGRRENLTVPAAVPVSAGDPFTVRLAWRHLDPTVRWFGVLRYGDAQTRTFVTVN